MAFLKAAIASLSLLNRMCCVGRTPPALPNKNDLRWLHICFVKWHSKYIGDLKRIVLLKFIVK